ncbi:MAG: hypothetical protein HGA61_02385 [Candidatus Moranbacteria bacterium]|nr:hypothetical protein [Candidatus Moranbacteria bacterium]
MITKDEEIKTTPIYIGYLILKILKSKDDDKVSIFEVTEKLKKELKIIHYRQIMMSLIFLYAAGVINFTDPYIYKT